MVCWFSEALPSGLLADAEYGRDLGPGALVFAGGSDSLGEGQVDRCHGEQCLADGSQVGSVGVWRCQRGGVQRIQLGLSLGADDEGPPVTADPPDRVADCVVHVFVGDAVLASAVHDLTGQGNLVRIAHQGCLVLAACHRRTRPTGREPNG